MRIIFIWLAVTIHSMASEKCEILHGKSKQYYDPNWGVRRTNCDVSLPPEIKCNYSGTVSYPDTSQLCKNDQIRLRFYSDKITVLPGSAFKTDFKISKLYLEDLGITKIIPGAFNHQSSVQSIFLSKNNLYQIGDGVFNSLLNLEELDLSENEISYISEDAFSGVPLKHLNVSNNNISSIPNSLTHVQVLDMSHNCIKSIPPRMFATSSLNISYNKIDKINLSYFPNISILYIASNAIENIDIVNTTMKELDLSDNKLTTLPGDLKELEVLNVTGNQISKLPNKTLIATNLKELILSDNRISDIPAQYFRGLGKLEILDISKNSLSAFIFGTFDNLQSLKTLNISYNKFTISPMYTFHSMKGLRNLNFSHNYITEVNVDDLLKHLPILRRVDIRGNSFTCHHLLEVFHSLQKHNVTFESGSFTGGNNIYGINCSGHNDLINMKEKSKSSDIDEAYTALLKYFNTEFKNSNFVQYLEKSRNEGSGIESSIFLTNLTEIFTDIKQLISEVTQSIRVQENSLETFGISQKQILETLTEIFGGLKLIQHISQHSEDLEQKQTKTEELRSSTVNAYPKENTPLLTYIAVLLTVMVGLMLVLGYIISSRLNKLDVELARLVESKPDSVNS
nr:unnamed protein product [Callosobruchus chinensis]